MRPELFGRDAHEDTGYVKEYLVVEINWDCWE